LCFSSTNRSCASSLMNPIYLVLFIVLVQVYYSCGQVYPIERRALVSLYTSTAGASWTNSWPVLNATSDPCANNWHGIQCNNNNMHIYSLVLQSNGLTGTIPAEIGDLTYLEFLYLSKNRLSGTIPETLGKCRLMLQLGLDVNQLTGTLPASFANLRLLQRLFLQDNVLHGTLETLVGIRDLAYLYLSRNAFEGNIPAVMGDLFLLEQIGLDSNNFNGTIPAGFGTKQNRLDAFYAQNNNLVGVFPRPLCTVPNCDASGNLFVCPAPQCCRVTSC